MRLAAFLGEEEAPGEGSGQEDAGLSRSSRAGAALACVKLCTEMREQSTESPPRSLQGGLQLGPPQAAGCLVFEVGGE